jgi:uncharacterized protein (TIGR00297 family)
MLSLADAAGVFRSNIAWALAVNLPIALIAYRLGVVRGTGLVAGVVYGITIYSLGGLSAFLILLSFFLMGSAISKIGLARKIGAGAAEEREGARGAGSVIGKCTVGVILSLLIAMAGGIMQGGFAAWLGLAYAGAFAAALADTCSSELGPVFGGKAILLTTFRSAQHGTPGAVSLAGTVCALAGAISVGILASVVGVATIKAVLYVTVSSFVAGIVESCMRALWGKQTSFAKQASNAFLTLVGALGAVLLAFAGGY